MFHSLISAYISNYYVISALIFANQLSTSPSESISANISLVIYADAMLKWCDDNDNYDIGENYFNINSTIAPIDWVMVSYGAEQQIEARESY